MQYKSWNKIQLYKHLKKAEKIRDKIDVGILKQLICDTIIPFEPDVCPNTPEFNKNLLSEYSYYLPHIEDFANTTPAINDDVSYIHIPTESQLEFAYELFSNLFPKWMDIFDAIYKERKKNLKIAESGNYSVYLNSIDYSYISINRNESIDDVFNLIHEYTHAIVDRIYFRLSYNSHYPYIELPSITTELIGAVFMKDFYLDIDADVDAYLAEVINIVIDYANNIMNINNSLDGNSIAKETITHQSLIHDISYVIPFMHAFELFFMFFEDREKWFYTLNKIITLPNSDNFLEETKKLGLTPNKDVKRFIDDLDNHLIG